jgi:hypothetical protein
VEDVIEHERDRGQDERPPQELPAHVTYPIAVRCYSGLSTGWFRRSGRRARAPEVGIASDA